MWYVMICVNNYLWYYSDKEKNVAIIKYLPPGYN